MQFVSNANEWLKKYSTWIFGLIAFASMLQVYLPVLQLVLPGALYNWALAVVALGGIFATQLKQPNLTKPPAAD